MNILLLETATEACSVALQSGAQAIGRFELAPQRHTQRLLPMVESILAEAGLARTCLDAIAYSRGPGSFTGVRIAASAAQGMALALDCPAIPVSSLAILAQGIFQQNGARRLLVGFDARIREVYWGAYTIDAQGLARVQGEECVCPPGEVPLPTDDAALWHGAGSGWDAYQAALSERLGRYVDAVSSGQYPQALAGLPLACDAWRCGEVVAPEAALPVYLRDRVV